MPIPGGWLGGEEQRDGKPRIRLPGFNLQCGDEIRDARCEWTQPPTAGTIVHGLTR